MLNRFRWLQLLSLTAGVALLSPVRLIAQDPRPARASKEELIKKLEQTLTGAKMTGQFTVIGKDDKPPAAEEYTITSAKHTGDNVWLLNARIKYGGTDKTLPVPLEIEWAGETPIISMTNMAIPGLGDKFSTRVVIYDGLYSGTWSHGPVKGHLFGTITKADEKQ